MYLLEKYDFVPAGTLTAVKLLNTEVSIIN